MLAACGAKSDDVTGSTTPATTSPGGSVTVAPATTAPAPTVQPVRGGRLVVAGEAEVSGPWMPETMICDSYCHMRARSFYDPLMVTDADLQPVGFLLESITPNDDFTVWTLQIREGITFHDGTPLDAEAVAFNLQASGNGALLLGALRDVARGPDGKYLITPTGPLTVEIRTGLGGDPTQPRPWPSFPSVLTTQWGLMASPAWITAVKAGQASPTEPVGTGPFVVTSYAPGDRLIVERNENYWLTTAEGDQLPYLDEIEFRIITDSQVRGQALRSGDVDLIATSDGNVVRAFDGDPNFTLTDQNRFGETNYIIFNLGRTGPLQDRSVRCALWQALDGEQANEDLFAGYLQIANGPFSPGQEGYLDDNGSPAFDPEAARAAIAAYEAANGPVVISYSSTPTATNLALAQYLKAVWEGVGVEMVINQVEQSTLINTALLGSDSFDAFAWRNHAGLVIDNQYFWWSSTAIFPQFSLNFGRLADPVIDDLLARARGESDPDARRRLAEDVNRRFAEQCWIMPLAYTKWAIIAKPTVQNLGRSPQAEGSGFLRDGQGFPGHVWMQAVFLAD